ncbi:MAG: hypothetical protein KC613_23935, partial [Myxococcales bacterium]|nr:hypothetical protein [Myxococcales bacterium]
HCNEFDSTRLAVQALVREGRVRPLEPESSRTRYEVVGRHLDLYSHGDWEARIDALQEHLEAVTETVRRRFLSDEPELAAARTFTFQARPEDVEALRDEFFAFIRERYRELEARAADAEDARTYAVYAGATPLRDELAEEE